MAYTLRFASGFLLRNPALIRSTNRSTSKLFSTEAEQTEIENKKPTFKPSNYVTWAGVAVDDCGDSNEIYIKNGRIDLRVTASRDTETRNVLRQVKAGMNVFVEGMLQHQSAVTEDDAGNNFMIVRSQYIRARKIEILDTEEAGNLKFQEIQEKRRSVAESDRRRSSDRQHHSIAESNQSSDREEQIQ